MRRRDIAVLLPWAAAWALGCGGDGGALPKVVAPAEILTLERAMADRVNRDRAESGLPPLEYDDRLADIARFHADDMQKQRFFAHDSPTSGSLDDRIAKASYLAAVARENLAEAPDVDQAEEGLLKSPGHKANILSSDVTHLGVGIVRGGLGDPKNFLFVQVFARPVETETPAVAADRIESMVLAVRSRQNLPPIARRDVLDEIASVLVGDVADDIAPGSLERAGKAAIQAVAKRKAGISSVAVTGARILASSEYTPPAAALAPQAKAFGLAVAPAKDEKGHPALKVLLLVGM